MTQLEMFKAAAPERKPEPKPELGTMRAITLWRPWSWTIVNGWKPIENRPWSYPRNLHGKLIAIHAGKKWDEEREALGLEALPTAAWNEGIVGVVRLVGEVRSADAVDPEHRVWFFGPYGWLLAEAYALKEPIDIRGAQGFWRVPRDIQQRIESELEAAA